MVKTRAPARAGQFYPGTGLACRQQIAQLRAAQAATPPALAGATILGALAPHAGWSYSGSLALQTLDALARARNRPQTLVLFATSHNPAVRKPALQSQGAWRVPTGELQIDQELATALLEACDPDCLAEDPAGHNGDHAIEVLLPLIQESLPETRFVPVALPHGPFGVEVGRAAAAAIRKTGRQAIALASTDLTHYGLEYYGWAPQGSGPAAHRWAREVNDGEFLRRALALDAEGAFDWGTRQRAACGPGATAAAIRCARELGASRGILLQQATSWELDPQRDEEPHDWVGYAALVWI